MIMPKSDNNYLLCHKRNIIACRNFTVMIINDDVTIWFKFTDKTLSVEIAQQLSDSLEKFILVLQASYL